MIVEHFIVVKACEYVKILTDGALACRLAAIPAAMSHQLKIALAQDRSEFSVIVKTRCDTQYIRPAKANP